MLFVEKLSESTIFRENLTKCALNRLAVPGVVFLSRPVAAVTCAGINLNTALVANLGWRGITVTPVVHGVPLVWNQRQSEIGAEYLCAEFKKRSIQENPEFEDLDLNLFDDILARLGYIRDFDQLQNPTQVHNG